MTYDNEMSVSCMYANRPRYIQNIEMYLERKSTKKHLTKQQHEHTTYNN